jgi:hypothetical protein
MREAKVRDLGEWMNEVDIGYKKKVAESSLSKMC